MKWIYDLSPRELHSEITGLGLKPYISRQISSWLYKKIQPDISRWTDISRENRSLLQSRLDTGLDRVIETASDGGGTRKFLIRLRDGVRIEAVMIPEKDHTTFCISSQAGCPLGCAFCETGRSGFTRNLTSGEILGQVLILKQFLEPSSPGKLNLVFMGMGEPLLNYGSVRAALQVITAPDALAVSPRAITVSTAGILPRIRELYRDFPNIKLSVSLNASDPALRRVLMPSSRLTELPELLDYLGHHQPRYRVTLIYVLLKGINDSARHAGELAGAVKKIRCKINLIPFNENRCRFQPPDPATVDRFARDLREHHLTVTVRWSKGEDIHAACGQLALNQSA